MPDQPVLLQGVESRVRVRDVFTVLVIHRHVLRERSRVVGAYMDSC